MFNVQIFRLFHSVVKKKGGAQSCLQNRLTDGQGASIRPLNFVCEGYNKKLPTKNYQGNKIHKIDYEVGWSHDKVMRRPSDFIAGLVN